MYKEKLTWKSNIREHHLTTKEKLMIVFLTLVSMFGLITSGLIWGFPVNL